MVRAEPPRLATLATLLAAAARRTAAGLVRHHAFDAAAAMTFYFFLGLIPLLVFLGYALGRVTMVEGVDQVLAPILATAPGDAARVVREELRRMGDDASVAPLSLAGFLYLTSSGTHNLMDLLEVAAGAPARGWWRQRAIAIGWNFAAIATLTALAWITLRVGSGPDLGAVTGREHPLVMRLVAFSLSAAQRAFALTATLATCVGALALFFRIAIEHPPHVGRRVFPGAVLAVTTGAAVTWGFGVYVSTLGRYAVYYGSLAAVATLLVWLYLMSLAILTGAEVNAQLEGLRDAP